MRDENADDVLLESILISEDIERRQKSNTTIHMLQSIQLIASIHSLVKAIVEENGTVLKKHSLCPLLL